MAGLKPTEPREGQGRAMRAEALIQVVIPALNEAQRLPLLLADLAAARQRLGRSTVGLPRLANPLVVDGGSGDGTPALARLAGARVISSAAGRGIQLQRGAQLALDELDLAERVRGAPASGAAAPYSWLLLLHADARLGPHWLESLQRALAQPPAPWCFQLRIEGSALGLRLVERAVALRTRLLHRPYGDQGLLIPCDLYRRVGGYRPWPLMEDLDLVERLAALLPVRCMGAELRVDGRRWRRQGVMRTAWRNWQLRRAWHGGTSPERLANTYYGNEFKGPKGNTRRRSGAASAPTPSPGRRRTPPRPDRRTG